MMVTTKDFLRLKWGTIKAFDFSNSPEAFEAYEEYNLIGHVLGAAQQEDTPRQKELICEMIDKVNGTVYLHWDGIDCTNDREKAKRYVMMYGTEEDYTKEL